MPGTVKDIRSIPIDREVRVCADCGYELGFHLSLIPAGDPPARLDIILICPNCGARYDIGRSIGNEV